MSRGPVARCGVALFYWVPDLDAIPVLPGDDGEGLGAAVRVTRWPCGPGVERFAARAQIVRLADGLGSLDFRLRGNDGDRHGPDTIRPRPLVVTSPRWVEPRPFRKSGHRFFARKGRPERADARARIIR